MLNVTTFRVLKDSSFQTLKVWPFGIYELRRLISYFKITDADVYIAVNHPLWDDCFHPPNSEALVGNLIAQGAVMKTTFRSCMFLQQPEIMQSIVDFKLFVPFYEKPQSGDDVILLENIFLSGTSDCYEKALNSWGGMWIYMHDASCVTFTCGKQIFTNKEIFNAILQLGNYWPENDKDTDYLWDMVVNIGQTDCLALAWFRDIVISKTISSNAQTYQELVAVLKLLSD